jgi:hypothetical protein
MASAALLLGERPSALEVGGAVLICAGLAATLAPPGRRRRSMRSRAAGLDRDPDPRDILRRWTTDMR